VNGVRQRTPEQIQNDNNDTYASPAGASAQVSSPMAPTGPTSDQLNSEDMGAYMKSAQAAWDQAQAARQAKLREGNYGTTGNYKATLNQPV
jgi:hypothetical protein